MNDLDVTRRGLGVTFRGGGAAIAVWSPEAREVAFCCGHERVPLSKDPLGYWKGETAKIRPNDLYTFSIDGKALPDPASLCQPEGVHGPSRAADVSVFRWDDDDWRNLPLDEYILYELHVGCFTPEGTFQGIEGKLDRLVELGVNAIELMPVAQFPGGRNWGYDGVFPFAVQHSYGAWEGLQHLVNRCHEKGMAVVLDVVYNHLGPEGNYLGSFGPYTTDKYTTPWGSAMNFDDTWCDGVRRYFIENALMWLRDFRIDALRLDAVHAIKDFSPKHVLREMRERVNQLMKHSGRRHYLIVESDLNDDRYINAVEKGGHGMNAQWVDEFHHTLRVAAGGDKIGYYGDFNGIEHLAKAYRDAYVYDGQFSTHRKRYFGVKTENEGSQFVVFSQNHDQVGNRMLGERTSRLASFEMQKLLAGAVMVSPYLPMLFMGEEWSEPRPFLYFVSHTDPELAEAVRQGRKEEFAAFHGAHEGSASPEPPDPMSQDTFLESKLQWEIFDQEPHRSMWQYYRALIALRKACPPLRQLDRSNLEAHADPGERVLVLRRWAETEEVICLMNFSNEPRLLLPRFSVEACRILFNSSDRQWRGPGPSADVSASEVSERQAVYLQPESIIIYMREFPD